MSELDRERIRIIVQQIADRLEGDWLLVGGALVALWLEPGRTTEDIDVVGIAGNDDPRLSLLELADEIGIPVEALNSAADFFVQRIPGWNTEIELLVRGARGRVFRPSPTLFLLLKLGRLSAQDLSDCLNLLRRAREEGLPVDVPRVEAAIGGLEPSGDAGVRTRRQQLAAALSG